MKKLLAGMLALVMVLSLCSMAFAANDEPITVTVFIGAPGDQPTDDNRMYKLIEEEFGVKFEFEFLAGDLDETLGTKIAGEDYADLMDGGNSAEKLEAAGAFIDMLPYITKEKTPNLYKHLYELNENLLNQLLTEDGKLYIIPNYGINYNDPITNYCNGPSFFIQKQVLAWDNYPQIKTLNEYFDLIERFLAANPTNADGTKYTGFSILCEDWRRFCLINPVQHLMGRPNDGEVIVDVNSGNWETVTFINQPYAKHYYQKLNEEFNKGLISKDTFVMTYDQYIAAISTGTVLGMFDQYWNFQDGDKALKIAGKYENTYIALPLVYDESYGEGTILEQYFNGVVPNKDRGFGISVNCEYPERMVQLLDGLLSDKWQTLLQWGVEGEDYTINEDGRMIMTREQYDQVTNNVPWATKNMAKTIWESSPKKQGTMDNGNAWAPGDQGENYFMLMDEYDQKFLSAYNYKKPADFFRPACDLAPYGEAWQIDKTPIQIDYDDYLAIQDRMLPTVIMSKDAAEFDANWDAFLKEIEPTAKIYTDFMQKEVLALVDLVTK